MRLTQALDVYNRLEMPTREEIVFKYTHLSVEEIREIRKRRPRRKHDDK